MSISKDSLENFFQMFDTTDDQGWCDIGYETCAKITESYKDEDWREFLDSIEHLNYGVYLGILEIMPLAPERFHADIIEILLVHAKGEAWLEAFTEYSKISQYSLERAEAILGRVSILDNFEEQFIAWVNFEKNKSEDFLTYYNRYSHLISPDAQGFYESLRKST